MIYLALPYGHKEPAIVAYREAMVLKATAFLLNQGKHIISPMLLTPCFIHDPQIPKDWAYWEHYSTKLMSIADSLMVFMLPGWEQSTGVTGEIHHANELGIPIEFLGPHEVNEWINQREKAET